MKHVPHTPPHSESIGPDTSAMREWPTELEDMNHPLRRGITYIYQDGLGADADAAKGVNIALRNFFIHNRKAFFCCDGTGCGKTGQLGRTALGALYILRHRQPKPEGHQALIVVPDDQVTQNQTKLDKDLVYLCDGGEIQPLPDTDRLKVVSFSELEQQLTHEKGQAKLANISFFGFDETHLIARNQTFLRNIQQHLSHAYRMYASSNLLDHTEGVLMIYSEIHQVKRKQAMEALDIRSEGEALALGSSTLSQIAEMRDSAIKSGWMIRREHPFWGRIEAKSLPFEKEQAKLDRKFIEKILNAPEQRTTLLAEWKNQIAQLPPVNPVIETANLVIRELSKMHRPIVYSDEFFLEALEKQIMDMDEDIQIARLSESHSREKNQEILEQFTGVSTRGSTGKRIRKPAIADVILIPESMYDGIVGINQGKIATKLKDMRRRTLIITSFSTVTNLIEQLGRLNRADSVAPAKAILLFGESAQDLAETKGIIEALHASEVTSGGPVVRQLLKALPDKLHRMEEQLRRLHERNAILADMAS